MRTLKCMMAYRGTRYHGFQRQENAHTVQEAVEQAVGSVLNHPVTIYGCSRTDTGVHARQYCFSFQTDRPIPTLNLVRGVNGRLPADISLLSAEDAAPDFHARYACRGKEYLYLIHNSESPNPFLQDLACHHRRPIDPELMQACADRFIGIHDFKSFCSAQAQRTSTIRTIYDFSVEFHGDSVILLVKGDGFLYNMIRILVGTMLDVNDGRLRLSDLDGILAARDRQCAGKTALACGLYLNRVFYDDVFQAEPKKGLRIVKKEMEPAPFPGWNR